MEAAVTALREEWKGVHKKDVAAHKEKVLSMAWNNTGRRLATASRDETVRVWSIPETGANGSAEKSVAREAELKGHTKDVEQVCWDPTSSDTLATVSTDDTVRIWDMRQPQKCALTVTGVGKGLNVQWSSDGLTIATSNEAEQVRLFDPRKGVTQATTAFVNGVHVNDIAWHPTMKSVLAVATTKGNVEFMYFGMAPPKSLYTASVSTAPVYSLRFDAERGVFAVGCGDDTYSVWDLRESICLRSFSNMQSSVRMVSFSHDGSLIAACGSEDTRVDVCHVASGLTVCQPKLASPASALAWNPKCGILAFASTDDHRDSNVTLFGFKNK